MASCMLGALEQRAVRCAVVRFAAVGWPCGSPAASQAETAERLLVQVRHERDRPSIFSYRHRIDAEFGVAAP